jgi:hypothetical protein
MRGCELCMHYDLLLLLSTSTKHYQKKKKTRVWRAHLLTGVAMWPHNCAHADWNDTKEHAPWDEYKNSAWNSFHSEFGWENEFYPSSWHYFFFTIMFLISPCIWGKHEFPAPCLICFTENSIACHLGDWVLRFCQFPTSNGSYSR